MDRYVDLLILMIAKNSYVFLLQFMILGKLHRLFRLRRIIIREMILRIYYLIDWKKVDLMV